MSPNEDYYICPRCGGILELALWHGGPCVECSGCMAKWIDLKELGKEQKEKK